MSKRYLIPEALAKEVVEILHNITGDNVNVMDRNGIIIATKQKHCLGKLHEDAHREYIKVPKIHQSKPKQQKI